MDFEKYKNTESYPTKNNFTTYYYYNEGMCVFTSSLGNRISTDKPQVFSYSTHEKKVDEEAYSVALQEWREQKKYIRNEFKKDALEEVGLTNHPKADKIFDKAWKDGHSAGLGEVFNHLVELAELFD